MCRHLAYLGPSVSLRQLLLEPAHSLLVQSYAPRHQVHGRVNADGFGVAWFDDQRPAEPARYRKPVPMWNDQTFASIASVVRTGALVASVRDASPGLPVNEACTAPYLRDQWVFAHNGRIVDWHGPKGAGVVLRRRLSDTSLAAIEGATDSEVVFGLVMDAIADGATARDALVHALRTTRDVAPGSRLNLVLCDGEHIVATRCGDSLFTWRDDERVVIASEPFDDAPGWEPVPDDSLVVASLTDLSIGALL
jgi:glutamine amidotransferase